MTVTNVDACNRALQMIGTRNNIDALTDTSEEAQNCSLLFEQIRDQVLGMAFWNFGRKTANLNLVRAAPGTPESPVTNATIWTNTYPAPPWNYEYVYPNDCIQFRYVIGQPSMAVAGVPIFSTAQYTYANGTGGPPQRFVVAIDVIGVVRGITAITRGSTCTVTAAAHGFINGALVYITGVFGMTQINFQVYTIGSVTTDTFVLVGVNSTNYNAFVLGGSPLAVNQSVEATQTQVILTNASWAVGCYTQRISDLSLWPQQTLQALVCALAGYLAVPLARDKTLASMLVKQANSIILDARVTDANEGMTIQETIPDWIRVRGDSYWGGDSNSGIMSAPYPPLFAVS